jgi:hypothetical protein
MYIVLYSRIQPQQQNMMQPIKRSAYIQPPPMANNNSTYFIDRDGRYFAYVLNYLRDGKKMVLPLHDEIQLQMIAREGEVCTHACV